MNSTNSVHTVSAALWADAMQADSTFLLLQVIDEADRMMEDILRHDWLRTVVKAAYSENPDAYFSSDRTDPPPQLTIDR